MWLLRPCRLLLWDSRHLCSYDNAGWTSHCRCSDFHSESPRRHLQSQASTRSPAHTHRTDSFTLLYTILRLPVKCSRQPPSKHTHAALSIQFYFQSVCSVNFSRIFLGLTFPLLFSVRWKWTFVKPVITSGLRNNTAQSQTAGRRERKRERGRENGI